MKSLQIAVPMPISLGLQFTFSYLAAALIVIIVTDRPLALMLAIITGLILTYPVQRSLWRLDALLKGEKVPLRRNGALSGIMRRIAMLVEQADEVAALRQNLINRVQDTAAQQERNRLARDLHDTIKQQIFSIQMSAAAAQARWTHDPEGAQNALGDVRRLVGEVMVELNALLQQLSPAPLEKVGLIQALRDQCEAVGYRAGVTVITEFGRLPDDDRLPAGTGQSLFRLTQEALSNIARHARAQNVRLYLGQSEVEGPLVLEISDDGQGFDPGASTHGMGLSNIRQRVDELGGTLTITSQPNAGTILKAVIPLLKPVQSQEEIVSLKLNHPLHKICAVGLIGGITLIIALYYPLYGLLPGQFLADWPEGSPLLGLILQITAAMVALGTGYLAAYWSKTDSRRAGTLMGALAGGIAGLVLYVGLSGAAAGVLGAQNLVRYGVAPAADEAQFLWLVAEPTLGIMWWTHGVLWLHMLTGIGLGAMGGLLFTPRPQPVAWNELRHMMVIPLSIMVVTSGFGVLAAGALYQLLEPSIRRLYLENNFAPPLLPLEGITALPIITMMTLYLTLLTIFYFVMRAEHENPQTGFFSAQPIARGFPYLVMVCSTPLLLRLLDWTALASNIALKAVVVGGVIISLTRGLQLFYLSIEARRKMEAEGTVNILSRTQQLVIAACLGVILLLFFNAPELALIVLIITVVVDKIERRNEKKVNVNYYQLWLQTLQNHLNTIFVSITGLSLIVLVSIPTALAIMSLVIPTIPALASYDPAMPAEITRTMTELVQASYGVHLQALLMTFLLITAAIGIFTLLIWAVLRLIGRQRS